MAGLYSEVILDHFRNPRNYGSLPEADIVHEDLNPLCGDRIRIELIVRDGIVREARFKGDGCAISLAAASLLTELIVDVRIDRGELISNEGLISSMKSDIKPARMKCALLALDALRSGVEIYRQSQRDQ